MKTQRRVSAERFSTVKAFDLKYHDADSDGFVGKALFVFVGIDLSIARRACIEKPKRACPGFSGGSKDNGGP